MNIGLSKIHLEELAKLNGLCRIDPRHVIDRGLFLLSKYEKTIRPEELAELYKCVGFSYCFISKFEEALKNSSLALDLFLKLDNKKGIIDCYFNIGSIYFYAGNSSLALINFSKSLDISVAEKEGLRKANAYNGIGSVYSYVNQTEKALKHLTMALNIARDLSDRALLGRISQGIAGAYLNSGDISKAIYYTEDSVEIYEDLEIPFYVALAYVMLGNAYRKKEDYNIAVEYYNMAFKLFTKLENEQEIISLKITIASVEIERKRYEVAKKLLTGCEQLLKNKNFYKIEKNLVNNLIKLSRLEGKDEIKLYERLSLIQTKIIDRELSFNGELIGLNRNVTSYEAFENQKTTEQLRKTNESLRTLTQIGEEIASVADIKNLIDKIYEKLNSLLDASVLAVSIYDKEKNKLVIPETIEKGKKLGSVEISLSEIEKLAVRCYLNTEEIVINNNEEFERNSYIGESPSSLVYLPLKYNKETIGTITVQSFKRDAYNSDKVDLLRNLSVYISIAVENAYLLTNLEDKVSQRTKEVNSQKEALEESYKSISRLNEIGKTITQSLSVEEIVDQTIHNVLKLMPAEGFGIGIYNKEVKGIDKICIEEGEKYYITDFLSEEVHSVKCFKDGRSIIINKVNPNKTIIKSNTLSTKKGKIMNSIVYFPLITDDRCFGVFTVQSVNYAAYSDGHIKLLENIAAYLSVALNNALAHKQLKEIGEIGQEITSINNLADINHLVYNKLQSVMDLTGFGIGIHNKVQNALDFHHFMEDGKELEFNRSELSKERFAVICFKSKETIHVNNFSETQKYISGGYDLPAGELTNSFAYVPLMKNDNCIGVVTVQATPVDVFSKQDVSLIQNLAPYVAVAIENANSFSNLAQLSLIGKEVTSLTDIGKVIDMLHERIGSFMDTTILLVGLHDEKEEKINIVKAYEEGVVVSENYLMDVGDKNQIASYCVKNKTEFFSNTIEERLEAFPNSYKSGSNESKNAISLIYIPLISEDKVIGVLSVQSFIENQYTEEHIEILRNVASYLTITINNINAYEILEKAKDEMEKLSIVASETDNGIIIANHRGEIEWINDAYTLITGYTLKDLFDNNKSTIHSISSYEGIDDKFSEVILKKMSVNYEGLYVDKSGIRRFVQTNLTPILDEKGEIKKLVAIDADITLQKLAEIEIREKNKDITDSINYAKRIQDAILPSEILFKTSFPESFIYFQPRDIVSGDFYWLANTKNDEIVVAAVDCTGHGVPGAFLTIVGNSLLNQIVNIEGETSPGKILEKMNIKLLALFNDVDESRINDGMDMSVCKFKKMGDKTNLTYSGAYNSVFYVAGKRISELKANRFAIGTPVDESHVVYKELSVDLKKGSMVYLFSDGYADQAGGLKGKKFMKRRFKEYLLSISKRSLKEQKNELKNNFEEWSGINSQMDDVLVIGIKV